MIIGKNSKPKLQKTNRLYWVLHIQFVLWVLSLASFPVYAAADCGQAGAPACAGDILKIIQNIIGLLAPTAAVAFLVMMLFGGFKFITSGGDQKQVSSARSTMTNALLGIVLVVVVWLVLLLVRDVTGIDPTQVHF